MPIKIGQRPGHGFDEPLGLLGDCHRRIEYFLQVLTATAQQASGGSLNAVQRKGLESALEYFATAAPRHTKDEEDSLFPRIRQSADASAADALATIDRLEQDHGEAQRHHTAVDVLVTRWLADDALDAADVAALREHLSALDAIYEAHIAVEDREVFPAAARLLSAEELAAIGREMESRRSREPVKAR